MKKVSFCFLSFFFLILMAKSQAQASPSTAAPASTPQPVYIYLYSRVTDHVNLDITEAQLRALLPMMERMRGQNPQAHVSACVLFSGAASDALERRNAQTGIKNMILDYYKRGVIEIGYDGTDEPTYSRRPMTRRIREKQFPDRWMERATEEEKFLTEGRHPLTGEVYAPAAGGLKRMQEVFGKAACINGVSVGEAYDNRDLPAHTPGVGNTPGVTPEIGDWEVIPVLRRLNTDAVLFGLPASNPAHIPGFNGSIAGIGKEMSPALDTSPEVFWADNVLRTSESGGLGARVLHGYEGVGPLKEFMGKLNTSKIRVIHMELLSENDFLKPEVTKAPLLATLTYAYAHPDNPLLPADMRAAPEESNAALAKEESALNWLISEYFPTNPGSRFLSNTDLRRMTPASSGHSIPTGSLVTALKSALDRWGIDTFPPSYVPVGSQYLSLAETFQVLTDALAEFDRTGALPKVVTLDRVYGPFELTGGHGPNIGNVKISSITKACVGIAAILHDHTDSPLPKNVIPPAFDIDGIHINAAQLLRLMAEAILDPAPQKLLKVKMTYMTPATAQMFPKTRAIQDTGSTWTFKPAPLNAAVIARQIN